MDITLKQQLLIQNIGAKYLMETGSNEPIPPKGILVQSVDEACAKLTALCGRFLKPSASKNADDTLGVGDEYVFHFDMSERRAANKSDALAMLMHSYIVNAALAKLLATTAALANTAQVHDSQALADAQSIDQLLRSKLPPI